MVLTIKGKTYNFAQLYMFFTIISKMKKIINAEMSIFGRVQGVNFRNIVKNFCEKNEIRGFVENKVDGSVYIKAIAEEEKVKILKEWIESSPGISSIRKIDFKSKISSKSEHTNFFIKREDNLIIDKIKGLKNLARYSIGR